MFFKKNARHPQQHTEGFERSLVPSPKKMQKYKSCCLQDVDLKLLIVSPKKVVGCRGGNRNVEWDLLTFG